MTAFTIARLTLREAARRKVVRALLVLTVVLLALSAWGFSKLVGLDTDLGTMTSGEARLIASLLLNLVMFGMSLIAALGTAFLAGPTVAGEERGAQGGDEAHAEHDQVEQQRSDEPGLAAGHRS